MFFTFTCPVSNPKFDASMKHRKTICVQEAASKVMSTSIRYQYRYTIHIPYTSPWLDSRKNINCLSCSLKKTKPVCRTTKVTILSLRIATGTDTDTRFLFESCRMQDTGILLLFISHKIVLCLHEVPEPKIIP